MPWRQLFESWDDGKQSRLAPMSLVTLSIDAAVPTEELAFYADAESSVLREWSANGRIILALIDQCERDLLLFSPLEPGLIAADVMMLPFVAAGLARFDIKAIHPLNFGKCGAGSTVQ